MGKTKLLTSIRISSIPIQQDLFLKRTDGKRRQAHSADTISSWEDATSMKNEGTAASIIRIHVSCIRIYICQVYALHAYVTCTRIMFCDDLRIAIIETRR